MKKNGFTLIELIAIIIILAVIALVSVPSFIQMQQGVSNEEKEVALKNLYIATESYILSDYKDEYDNSSFNICVTELIENGYVKADSINPHTEEKYTENDCINVKRDENNEFVFELFVDEKTYITLTIDDVEYQVLSGLTWSDCYDNSECNLPIFDSDANSDVVIDGSYQLYYDGNTVSISDIIEAVNYYTEYIDDTTEYVEFTIDSVPYKVPADSTWEYCYNNEECGLPSYEYYEDHGVVINGGYRLHWPDGGTISFTSAIHPCDYYTEYISDPTTGPTIDGVLYTNITTGITWEECYSTMCDGDGIITSDETYVYFDGKKLYYESGELVSPQETINVENYVTKDDSETGGEVETTISFTLGAHTYTTTYGTTWGEWFDENLSLYMKNNNYDSSVVKINTSGTITKTIACDDGSYSSDCYATLTDGMGEAISSGDTIETGGYYQFGA